MNAGALTLVDHVLPEVPIRQFATGAAKPRGVGAGRAGPSYAAFLAEISVGLRRKITRPSPAHLHRHRGVQLSQAPGRSGYCRRRVWRRHCHPARQQRPASLTAFSCPPARWRVRPIIPPPRRHVVRYSGVISSHSSLRSQILGPAHPATPARGFAAPVARPRRGRARGKRQAFTDLPSLQNPSPPHRHDRDGGHHQEGPVRHGLAHRGAQILARTTATLAIWWRGRRLAELTARRQGRDGVDCPACSRKPPSGPRNPVKRAALT
jgi:hypothetical protein